MPSLHNVLIENFIDSGRILNWDLNPKLNIIVGDNGSGKSMLLHFIKHYISDDFKIEKIDHVPDPKMWFTEEFCNLLNSHLSPSETVQNGWTFKMGDNSSINLGNAIVKFNEESSFYYYDRSTNFRSTFSLCGTGLKTLVTYIYKLYSFKISNNIPDVVLIDDIEFSLHINWQRKILDILMSILPDTQFIVTTHSPTIFFKNHLDKVYRMHELF